MSDEIKDNILSPSQWLRILFMVMYGFVCWVLGIVFVCLVIVQALFNLVTGKSNENLKQASHNLTLYFYQVLGFLTYCVDEKPFPFMPFPRTGTDTEEIAAEPLSFEDEVADDNSEAAASAASEEPPLAAKTADTSDSSASGEDDVFADISFTAPEEKDDGDEKDQKGSV